MSTNLVAELDNFEKRLKTEPQLAEVEWKKSTGGGGATDPVLIGILIAFALRRRMHYRH